MGRVYRLLSVLGLLVFGLSGALPGMAWPYPAVQAGSAEGVGDPATGPACELLDDPQVRRRMSAAFEQALLEVCGRIVPGRVLPGGRPLTGGIQLAVDVRVNVVDPAASSTTQSETSIDINRATGTLCAHWNDSYHYLVQGYSYIGYARSTDGGQTWQDGPANYLPQGGGGRARGDPSVAWRALDSIWYATSIHLGSSQGLGFWRSTDDCASFQWVGMAHAGSADDKELLAIDNNPASPHYGRMYIAWTDFASGMSVIYSDNGTSWSSLAILAYGSVQGAWPAVAPNGDVYVAWVRWTTGVLMDMEVARSTNGGATFTLVESPARDRIVPYDVTATQQCGRDALRGRIRYLPSPQIDIGPDGCLHVVYPYDPDGDGVGDVVNAYYRRSCTHGASWEAEVRLNDDATMADQFFPNVTVSEDNVVAASWYDRRLDAANNTLFDRYWTYSTDGGTTWQPNERISDVSSPVYIDPNMSTCYHGDYDQVASDADAVYLLWSDDRTLFNGHQDPDLWFERRPLGACQVVTGTAFAFSPPTPVVGQEVTFSGTATGTLPIDFSWDLGDGTGGAGAAVQHTYTAPGPYTVTMTAANCATATATVVHTITVVPPCDPVQEVDFSWMPLTPTVGQEVAFIGTATGTLPLSYTWALGDGSIVFGPSAITHTYTAPGLYTVTMTATNCATSTAAAVHTVTVVPLCDPVHGVDFAWTPLTPTVGQEVTFTGTATGTLPLSYTWDLGDGSGAAGASSFTHTYALAGPYTLTLAVSNCGGAATLALPLQVAPAGLPYRIYMPVVFR